MDRRKVWIFYLTDSTCLGYTNEDDNIIYAFTDNKELKKQFLLTRRNSLFQVEKIIMTNHEYNSFLKEFMHSELRSFSGYYRGKNNTAEKFSMPLTKEEELAVKSAACVNCNEKLYEYAMQIDSYPLKKEIQDALESLLCIQFKILGDGEDFDPAVEVQLEKILESRIKPNDLAVLMSEFHNFI